MSTSASTTRPEMTPVARHLLRWPWQGSRALRRWQTWPGPSVSASGTWRPAITPPACGSDLEGMGASSSDLTLTRIGVRVSVRSDELAPMPSRSEPHAGGVIAGLHVPDADTEGPGQVCQRLSALLPGHGHRNKCRATGVISGLVVLAEVDITLGRYERQTVGRQAVGPAGEHQRAQKVDQWPRGAVRDAGVPDHADVEPGIVAH